MKPGTSHDKLFKAAFEIFFKDLIELVHPELAATLDLDRLRFADKDLFADFRKQGHVEPDLVAETVTRDGEPRIVVVHLEVEESFERVFDRRMARYSMHLMLISGKPTVSVAVFLHGGTGGLEIREVSTRVGPLEIWRFRYLAFGLSQSLAEEYVDRPQPLAAALAALMRSEVWDKVERKLHCLRALSHAEHLDVQRRFVLGRIVETYIELDQDEEKRFQAELERELNEEVREMVVTWEEALAESRTEGRIEATREDILRLSRRKSPTLPPGFESRIRAIDDLDGLHAIFDQIVAVDSIEEVDLG